MFFTKHDIMVVSYKLYFHYKTCFKYAAKDKLENLQLKICYMTHFTVIAYHEKLLTTNLFQNFAFCQAMADIFGLRNITKTFIAL